MQSNVPRRYLRRGEHSEDFCGACRRKSNDIFKPATASPSLVLSDNSRRTRGRHFFLKKKYPPHPKKKTRGISIPPRPPLKRHKRGGCGPLPWIPPPWNGAAAAGQERQAFHRLPRISNQPANAAAHCRKRAVWRSRYKPILLPHRLRTLPYLPQNVRRAF